MDTDAFDGASALQQRWQALQTSPGCLPSYEDMVLGGLGRHADNTALVATNGQLPLAFLWGGARFERWLGQEIQSLDIGGLPADVVHGFREVTQDALQSLAPATTHCIRARQGTIESTGLLALPLANRQGTPLVLLFIEGVTSRLDLVDAIFRATNQGMLALSAVRDHLGEVFDFTILALNEGAARLLQKPVAEVCLKRLSSVVPNLAGTDGLKRLSQVLGRGGTDSFEFAYRTSSGKQIHFKLEVGCIGDLLAITLADISDVKASETSARLLFESNPVPMWLSDPESLRILRVNDAAVAHYGYSRGQFEGMTLLDLRPPGEREAAHPTIGRAYDLEDQNSSSCHLRADGSIIEVNSFARTITFEGYSAVLTAAVDVTERRQAEARIAYMAHHDALTDLPNRVLFRERLEAGLSDIHRHGGELALLCIDLDNLKLVNDTLGHPAGDEFLRQSATRLRSCLENDNLVARLGGDEFAILHRPSKGLQDVAALAVRIVNAFNKPFLIHGQKILSGASIGIAVAPGDGGTTDYLLRNADMALYSAKAEGGRTYRLFDIEMDNRLQARQVLEQDLRQAFSEGRLDIHYQPIVSLHAGTITACEALLRWLHPKHGYVSPAEFVPLAEDIGLIEPIGEWVLHQACREAATWPENIRVAINLSPAQFNSGFLVDYVRSALSRATLDPSRLELEITESVLLLKNDSTMSALHQLRDLGVRIAMDDFGTGYSSLSYLRAFPFDKIKIDRSFVHELGNNKHSTAIIRAITGLGKSLGNTTVAEGIETIEQLDYLRADGCDEVQGFLLSKPVPAAELKDKFATWKPEWN
ncbi:putative bifunctional diguanylate cyclase/phosphodiesterase [Microvirga roseola]|uniref:putative bifunctional diguanylate cyclase/phosphodiesterase n=1 Tax=Microvirga roseola TaxID=2883126 RepID=UPI001E28FF40|nr:EAL domain-containing protein [Microvirga roseola]